MSSKLKLSFALLSMFVFLTFSTNTFAQAPAKAEKNYAVLVQSAGHFRKAVRTAETMKESKNWNDFQIIICAKLVGELPTDVTLVPFIERAQKIGVNMVVCGLSMANFNVEESQLHPALKAVPNAFIYTFDLQENGYNTLVF